jgi:hypothetical protein
MKRKLFTCSEENVQNVQNIETGALVFLFNMRSNVLVGPFTAEGNAGLKPGGWREYSEKQANAAIRVEWENLHELKDAQDKFAFLKEIGTCKLTHFQTQDLLNALKEAPLLKTI